MGTVLAVAFAAAFVRTEAVLSQSVPPPFRRGVGAAMQSFSCPAGVSFEIENAGIQNAAGKLRGLISFSVPGGTGSNICFALLLFRELLCATCEGFGS